MTLQIGLTALLVFVLSYLYAILVRPIRGTRELLVWAFCFLGSLITLVVCVLVFIWS